MGPHLNSSALAVYVYIIYVHLLFATRLVNGEVKTEPQVFLALKPMLSTHTLHHYLNPITGPDAPISTNTTNSTTTINNKENPLWRAFCVRIRKLWLRHGKLTHSPN